MIDWKLVKELAETYKINFTDYFNPFPYIEEPDADGNEPGQLMIIGNRGPGKTTAFCIINILVNRIFQKKFIYIFRTSEELTSVSALFEDSLALYPKLGKEITTQPLLKNLIYEIFLDGNSVGFSICIGTRMQIDKLKKYSPIFKDCYLIIFEEFLTESGYYLPKEIEKLQSILVSISRGGGKMSAERKLIYLANKVAVMNPYFVYFGIYKHYNKDAKIIHLHGLNVCFNHDIRSDKAISQNPLLKAFENSDYFNYASRGDFLLDTSAFIQKPRGKSHYIFTVLYDSEYYGFWEYFEEGFFYFSTKYISNYQTILTFKPSDHNQNTMMLNNYTWITKILKNAYYEGILRFNDEKAKMVCMEILAIDIYK